MRLLVALLLLLTHLARLAHARGGYRGGGGGYKSSGGGSHTYPHSTGYSGTGSGGAHTYPHSNGMSGNSQGYNTHNYNYQHGSARYGSGSKTEVHHHYHYSPPQQISYGSTYHPVYHGTPPVYVYEYRNSGSRFDNLLTGLALYNLGRMSSSHHNNDYHYRSTPGEICKLGISKRTGEYEETRVDCKLMSSFILESSASSSQQHVSNTVTKITNTTKVTHSGDGTGSGDSTSVTSVTVTDALKVTGPSLTVTPGMTCFMIRIYRDTSTMRKNVECGLLQEYAQRSMLSKSSERLKPLMLIVLNFIFYYYFSYCHLNI